MRSPTRSPSSSEHGPVSVPRLVAEGAKLVALIGTPEHSDAMVTNLAGTMVGLAGDWHSGEYVMDIPAGAGPRVAFNTDIGDFS